MAQRGSNNINSLRILILNGDLPVFPGWGGVEFLHTIHLAKMARKVGLVSLVQTIEQNDKKKGLSDAGVNLFLWENPQIGLTNSTHIMEQSLFRQFAKFFYSHFRTWPPRPQDTLVQNFQFCNMSGPLLDALKNDNWHALIVVQSSCAHWMDYLPFFPARILVMHDVRALMYERRARSVNSLRQRLSYKFQAILYRHYERTYCRKYDLLVTVSEADKAWVQKHYKAKNVISIPIPVDTEYFAPMPEVPVEKNRIVFTGMMSHPPNIDAGIYFARQVFPKVKAVIPSAEFWIVGRDPAPEVNKLADIDGVIVTGFVDDIRRHIAQGAVIVVPILFGSGMRQKILEAWAMGKCVISTRIGAEGIDYQDNKNILIADDADTMANRVVEVIQNLNLSERISMQGRRIVTSKHNPDILSKEYYNAIESLALKNDRQCEPMKISIDLHWMLPGVAGGIENLAHSFVQKLLEIDKFNEYTLLIPSKAKYKFDLRKNSNFSYYVTDGPGEDRRKSLWRLSQIFHRCCKITHWRSPEIETSRRARSLGADVILSMSGYIHRDMFLFRNVLVVHDLQYEYHPEHFSSDALEERKRVFGDSILHADFIIAVSEYTRQTVIDKFKIDLDRITTLHEAADPIYYPENRKPGNKERVLTKYSIPEKGYLLFPGNTWPHKNHKGAIEALRIVHQEYGLDPLLVCTGTHKDAHNYLLHLIRELGLENKVKFLGYCPKKDMVGLYEGAAGLLYPSLFEGFGIPLVEAMWSECPIVCSNLTSLPEVAGDSALLIDPSSPEEMANAVARLLTDEELRRTLISRGRKRVLRFSWLNFATETMRILYRVAKNY